MSDSDIKGESIAAMESLEEETKGCSCKESEKT
jgi:hypothetical protein